ncbi:MAG: sulfatase [Puniceicoccaceae bacterium]
MRHIYLLLLCTVVSLCAAAESRPPNVLFILSDDLNGPMSGYGHPLAHTPNLDKFAETGVQFNRAYSQFPLCGPSRAAIMTGQYPLKNGVDGNGGDVDPARITLPLHFSNHGYWTGRVSKIYHMGIPVAVVEGTSEHDHIASWHEAYNITALETMTPGKVVNYTDPDAPKVYPKARKEFKATHEAGKPYKMPPEVRGDYSVVEVKDSNSYLLADHMAADKAIELLRKRADQPEPFFLAVGFVRPHFPFVTTEGAISHYEANQMTIPFNPADDYDDIPKQSIQAVKKLEEEPIRGIWRGYFGCITYMDQQVGRLLAELDRLKLRDNTIVVFVSDHGYLLSEHHMWKKNLLWEEAIQTPLIISAPGMKTGQKTDHIVELIDLYPTLTELAGLPQDPDIQGKSLTPLLKDPDTSLQRKDAFIHVKAGFGLRSGKWAYMWYPAVKNKKLKEGFMLYDLDKDPHQYKNLANSPEHKSIRKRLHSRLMGRIKNAKN